MTEVYIGLGSNLGSSREILLAALGDLKSLPAYREVARSGCWLSAPVGVEDSHIQPDYYNAVVKAGYGNSARELLGHLLRIEREHGRARGQANASRTLDLDLLLFGNALIKEPDLIVPHPRMTQRAFVLLPLMQLDKNLVVPGAGCTVEQCARALPPQKIREVAWGLSGEFY